MLALIERRLTARRLHSLIVGMPLDAAAWAADKATPPAVKVANENGQRNLAFANKYGVKAVIT